VPSVDVPAVPFVDATAYRRGAGTRLVFIDGAYRGFLYNPVNQLVLPVPKLHEATTRVMWDPVDWGVFVTTDNTYVPVWHRSCAVACAAESMPS
jgi:hypothetical protein